MLNGIVRNSMQAFDGTTVIWSVSYPGYITQTGSITVNGSDVELNVELIKDSETDKISIITQTESGDTTQGYVSINNQIIIDKSYDSISVELGTLVQICAKPADGYVFKEWVKNGEVLNSNPIQDVIAVNDTVYVARFISETEVGYWDFEVESDGEYDLFTVPTPSGTGEYEGLFVKVK